MNVDKESNLKNLFFLFLFFFFVVVVGGGGWGWGNGVFQYVIAYFCVLMFYIKFQVPSSSGSLNLTETKGITDR